MPLSKYNSAFGGKAGSAEEAHAAMVKQYGAKKSEQVFYATKNARLKSHMPKGFSQTPKGDLGARRQKENAAVGGFTNGTSVNAASYFKRSR